LRVATTQIQGGFKMFFGKTRSQQPTAERGKTMGANLWFRYGDGEAPQCSCCHQEPATGRDGLCTKCRSVYAMRNNKPPLYAEAVAKLGTPPAK